MRARPGYVFEFGAFRLVESERQLFKDGQPVQLPPKVFDTLLVLIENRGRLIDKQDLICRLWPDSFVEEINLNRSISTLRKALGESASSPVYIETVPKSGYRFLAPVIEVSGETDLILEKHTSAEIIIEEEEEITDSDPSGSVDSFDQRDLSVSADSKTNLVLDLRHTAVTGATKGLPGARQRILDAPEPVESKPVWKASWLVVALPVVLIGLIIALVYVFAGRKSSAVEAPSEVKSLAVLPFRPMGSESEDETLELGLADTLITRLSSLREIKVRPTSAVLKYAKGDYDPIQAGRALRADAVLEGSVQKVKDRLRITVRLFRVKDETPLWSGGFDESASDLLQVEDSISERVVKALRLNLASSDREALIRHQTSNAEAYGSYMKGRYFWNQRSREGLIKATEFFEKAISEDPNYARAYAGLADCYALRTNGRNFARDEGYLRAKTAATRALELDDRLAEAHASLGFILLNYDWDSQGAEGEFQRAIEQNPNYATAHQWYGQTLGRMGNLDEALREEKLAQELDPLSPVIYVELGGVYFHRRQFDQAVEQYQRALEIAPGFWPAHRGLAEVYAYKGMYKEVIEEYSKTGSTSATFRALIGYAYARAGVKDEAQKILHETLAKADMGAAMFYFAALIHSALGERDPALECLRKLCEARDDRILGIKWSIEFESLRDDPRFRELLRRTRLAD